MTYISPVVDITSDVRDSLLLPYTTSLKWRRLPTAITIHGSQVTRYQAPYVTEYIDLSTGEIMQAADLRNDPRVPPQIHLGEIMLQRQALMNSFRNEVREFAYFVLQFRNNRRGITPTVDTLSKWYAWIHEKRVSNVRRYVNTLEKAGLLAGSSLLSPLFQRTGKNKTTRDHLGEDFAASAKFMMLRSKMKRQSHSLT
jgi:hypothetical protein